VNIGIISNYHLIRGGLRALAERVGAVVSVEIGVGVDAGKELSQSHCDAALLDLTEPKLAAKTCRYLSSRVDSPPTTGVDCFGCALGELHELMAAGMRGYVSVRQNVAPLEQAIVAAGRGDTVIHMEVVIAAMSAPRDWACSG
jgi:DNA-binding NarL/FixJ family response regulator